jgi:hypothetical protein
MRSKYELLFAATLAIIAYAPNAAADALHYKGLCEASAAVRLDENHFVVASDDSETLQIYERGKTTPVGPPFTHEDVTDIEAAARIGDTIFWLTSHSLNRDHEDKKKRKVFFATKVKAGPSLEASGVVYRDMRAKVASILGEDENKIIHDFNIEGLAATPKGGLIVGLRGPLTKNTDKAQLVEIGDPFPLVGLERPPGVSVGDDKKFELHLDGRGVRSIDRVGSGKHQYLIVAGSVEDHGKPPALYWWDGTGEAEPGPSAPLEGMTPEALIAWNDHEVQILGDNGDNCSDKTEDVPRWFPSVEMAVQ